jgi:hypothetical protein
LLKDRRNLLLDHRSVTFNIVARVNRNLLLDHRSVTFNIVARVNRNHQMKLLVAV